LNPLHRAMPLLARHAGVWTGMYTHVRPDLTVIDRHDFRIVVELPDDGPVVYRQRSHYEWLDGRTEDRLFEGYYADGRVWWDDGRIRGTLSALDATTLYLNFAYGDEAGRYICEMIQLSPDGAHRARTWHWFRAHRLERLTVVRERRGD
jgi:Domain of unknown function (DUF3598), N-terminal